MTTELLEKVCALAREVGLFQAEQRKAFSRKRVEAKGSHDYVSYVDRESERKLVAALHEMLPDAGFLTEEKTTEQADTAHGRVWIVDPLDGTTNFIHDLAPWCVCIALKEEGVLTLSVVYEVTRRELFYATRGGGAWLRTADGNVRQLRVSPVSELDQSLVIIGYPYNADGFRDFCTRLTARLYGHCASIRSTGSAEAELCYVAAARADVYIESFIYPWDVSAGALILQEAGGRVSDYQGTDSLWPSGREVLATNGTVHAAMLTAVQQTLQAVRMPQAQQGPSAAQPMQQTQQA